FETTNLIRSNIFNKPSCTWAGGNATQGIHNLAGTVAYVVPGRNSSNWIATNESWEYTPSGVNWTAAGNPIGNTSNITVSPSQTTTYVATVTLCDGTVHTDDVIVTVGSSVNFSPSIVVPTNCSNQVGSIDVQFNSNSPGPFTYTWEGFDIDSNLLSNLDDGTYNVSVLDESNGCTYNGSFIVPVNSTLDITMSDTDIDCNGANNGIAEVTATSDFPGFTYLWSDDLAQTTSVIENLTPGLYSVEVSDADGCTASGIVVISEPSPIAVNFSQTPISCPGGSDGIITAIPSGGVGNFSLLWEGNVLSNSLSDLSEGEYSVTVFDNNGCTLESSSFIDDPEPIGAEFIVNAPSCAGIEDGIVSVVGTGGNGPYTYFWPYNGTNGDILDGLTSGDYDVIVTDNNLCIDTVTISISPVLELLVSTTVITPSCDGDTNGSISVTVDGGTPEYNFQWDDVNASTTSMISNLGAGMYNLVIEDANGCTGYVEIDLQDPAPLEASTTLQNPLCSNTPTGQIIFNIVGGTEPYAISSNSNPDGLVATDLNDGVYPYTVTDVNGCSVSGQATLVDPAPLQGSTQLANALCYGTATGSATATITGGVEPYTYQWSQNSNGIYFNNDLSAGPQNVIVTDQNGCDLTLNFVIGQPDPLSAEFTTTAANCNANNGSVSIDADGGYPPYTYYWTNSGTTNTTYSNQSAGSGSMILEDANGCNTTLNYSIPEIPVAVSFVTNVIEGLSPLQVEFINTSTGGNTYTWDFGDGSDPVVTSSTSSIFHTYTEEGSYDATLTASYNGSCDQTTSVTILVFEVSEITTVPNIISPNNDNHNDTFRVVSLNIRNLEVLIFDRWGRQVGELKSPTDEWNARDQSAGTYYYILRAEGYDGIKYEQEGHLTVVR
ncbi:MAG: hypothetical protein RLZZ262_2641, partial [Bacteroidota bacterium]